MITVKAITIVTQRKDSLLRPFLFSFGGELQVTYRVCARKTAVGRTSCLWTKIHRKTFLTHTLHRGEMRDVNYIEKTTSLEKGSTTV